MAGDFDESEPTASEIAEELRRLVGPYDSTEVIPARQATSPPIDGPVVRQEVKTERVEALRGKHLDEAREAILSAPPMSPEMRERLDRVWAAYDAAYPEAVDSGRRKV